MSETRMTIPARFYYTRLDQESVEVVRASDYDALRAQLATVTDALEVLCHAIECGEPDEDYMLHRAEEGRKALAKAKEAQP